MCTVCRDDEIKKLLKEHPKILNLWTKRKMLNEIQREALCCALKNRFQLIQGPPGQLVTTFTVKVIIRGYIVHALYRGQRPDMRSTHIYSASKHVRIYICTYVCMYSNSVRVHEVRTV